ncbi:MAG: hypothetical protein J5626_04145, partial [Lachnospiraceae bacterium]|nr:hypothetical protein [Lachnospiraceae bacterium]
KMPGGYLRVIYPQPEACLDLRSWQEFYGFDKTAKEGWFDFEIDVDKLTFKVTPAVDKPFFFGKAPEGLIYDPSTIKKDMGHEVGPFGSLKVGTDIKIDPREAE